MEIIRQIFNSKWAIRNEEYHHLLSLAISSIKNGTIDAFELSVQKESPIKAYATLPYVAHMYDLDSSEIPSGSVAVIPVQGVLFPWRAMILEQLLKLALNNDKIEGIVFAVDGPGGVITRVDVIEKLIRESKKPVVANICGMCASAHLWMMSACDKIFMNSEIDEIGSCGVVMTYENFDKYYESLGVEIRDIYPDTADLKNKLYRQLAEGKDKETKERLEYFHQIFAKTIAENLGVAYDTKDPLFRGEMFLAEEAISKGYVDGYATIEESILWVAAQKTVQAANKVIV